MKISLAKLLRVALNLIVAAPTIITAVKPVVDEIRKPKAREL